MSADATVYTVEYPLIIPHLSTSLLNSYVREHHPQTRWLVTHHSYKTPSVLAPPIKWLIPVGLDLERSWWFPVTGSVKEAEVWRPSDREGYRGQNLAAPLSQDIKVGQSVPWMISNSTFWGPIHWKYIYTHALSYIEREWGTARKRDIDKKKKNEYELNGLSIRSS